VRKKITLIEDDDTIAKMYIFKLKNAGFDVCYASNGHDGLALIKDHRPELIILDLDMPIMRGDDMLTLLRSTDWG